MSIGSLDRVTCLLMAILMSSLTPLSTPLVDILLWLKLKWKRQKNEEKKKSYTKN